MSLPINISAIGDTHTIQYEFVEQVASISSVAVEAGNTSATRTYDVEFRWGTDGLTWSAWLTYDTATASAIVLDADDRFYREVRITRTGTDTAGVISWTLDTMNYVVDPLAFCGHGQFTDFGKTGELFQLFKALIESKMATFPSGDKRVKVVEGWDRNQSNAGGLLPIIFYNLSNSGSENMSLGGCVANERWTVNIAVKKVNQTQASLVGGVGLFDNTRGRIRRMFDQKSQASQTYSITFKEVVFVDAKLSDFNIRNVTIADNGVMGEINDFYQVFSLNFTISNSKINYDNYQIT